MRSLMARRETPPGLRRDPAPSRLGYRWHRLMLSPVYRRLVRIGVPLALVAVIAGVWASHPENRIALVARYENTLNSIQNRPEFLVTALQVSGADAGLEQQVRTALPLSFPVSSFDLDLDAMRGSVQSIAAVERAVLRVRPGGVLDVAVTPRVPVAIWRDTDGLKLIDETGALVAALETRSDRLDLPLIAGDGAKDHIAEALRIYAAAGPITPRVRGLVRMGERRWDVLLDQDQRVLLPPENPVPAFQRVVVMATAQDLLSRDVASIDLRNDNRATIRMNPNAADRMRQVNTSATGAGE